MLHVYGYGLVNIKLCLHKAFKIIIQTYFVCCFCGNLNGVSGKGTAQILLKKKLGREVSRMFMMAFCCPHGFLCESALVPLICLQLRLERTWNCQHLPAADMFKVNGFPDALPEQVTVQKTSILAASHWLLLQQRLPEGQRSSCISILVRNGEGHLDHSSPWDHSASSSPGTTFCPLSLSGLPKSDLD